MSQKKTYHHLGQMERVIIAVYLAEGFSIPEIASKTGVNKSSIYRELARALPAAKSMAERREHYNPRAAEKSYQSRRKNSKPHGKAFHGIRTNIEDCLRKRHSPEQIAHTLEGTKVSFSTIYRWIYKGYLLGGDFTMLRQRGKRKIRKTANLRSRYQSGTSIHNRPETVENREEFGHFEVDSVLSGRGSKTCIFTLVERKTRFLCAYRSSNCSADNFFLYFKQAGKQTPTKYY